ncbi:MAG: sodium:proton antiporter, partial [Thermococcus sp.]
PGEALGVPLGGSLVLYNLFEYLAVGAGFTAVFLLLSIPEEKFKKFLGVRR